MRNKIIIFIFLFIVVSIALYTLIVHRVKAPVFSETQNGVSYFCNEGTFHAVYSTSSVFLALSTSSTMVLPQATSGSGIRYELGSTTFVSKGDDAFLMQGSNTIYNNCIAGSLTQVGTTSTFTDQEHTFSFMYPSQFTLSGGDIGYTQDWRVGTQDLGMLHTIVTIPRTTQLKTNFGGAKFSVGVSADAHAVSSCLIADYGSMQQVSTTTIKGVLYTKLVSTDVGAGNYYETTSYRTVRDGMCYAIEYTIHSSNIYNYSPDQGISMFNHDAVASPLDSMARSFSFF